MSILFALLLTILCCIGCTQVIGQKDAESMAGISNLTWYLASVNENGSQETLLHGTTISAFFDKNGTVAGSSGCNRYTAPYAGAPGRLEIGPPATTGMTCGSPNGVMMQEARYLNAIQRSGSFLVQENFLKIKDKEGVDLLTFSAIPPDLVATWRVTTFDSSKGDTWTPGSLTTVTLRFFPDGNITGNAGCNDYHGKFHITGENALAICTMGMTKMFCGIGGVMELEDAYMRTLSEMKYYSVTGERLFMTDTTGDILILCEKNPIKVSY